MSALVALTGITGFVGQRIASQALNTSTDGLTMKLDISATKRDLNWQPMPFEQSVLGTASSLEKKQSTGNGR